MLDVNISSIILQMYFTEQYVATKNGKKQWKFGVW